MDAAAVGADAMAALVARLRAAGCVFADDEAVVLWDAAAGSRELESMVRRREAGEPLEVIVGWVEFCGRRVVVAPGVFVPRRRTELLVHEAVRRARPGAVVVELCAGVGAVAALVAMERPDAEVYAAELDPVAAEVAGRNLAPERVFAGDLYDALPERLHGHIDVLVANAPYVPTAQIALMPAEAREFEPQHALDGGSDGLALQRRIAAVAREWLAPLGSLVVETSVSQAPQTASLMRDGGLEPRIVRDDALDATAVVGIAVAR